ncbi:MAG: SCO family protein [Chloroflexi bacterium]|nr:SCO family protein [Chloroflexota bacterium]
MMEKQAYQEQTARLRYVLPSILMLTLFAIGVFAGNVVSTQVVSSAESESTDTNQPGGAAIVEPPYAVQDFTLTDQRGEALSLSDLRGRAVLMFFGYINCPDVCPTTLADYTLVKEALGRDADDVAFVFISVDGKRDTPELMGNFLSYFDSSFIGLTGEEHTLRQLGKEYGLMFEQDRNAEDTEYFVQHTSPSFLIDPDGYLRMVFFYGSDPEAIVDGIREIVGS